MMPDNPSLVGIFLLTHGRQGECLLESVSHMMAEQLPYIATLNLLGTERRSEIEQQGRDLINQLLEHCEQVLVLSDLFGSTHACIVEKIAAESKNIACIHGVNLAMVLEACACRQLPLKAVQQKVVAVGKQAIIRGR